MIPMKRTYLSLVLLAVVASCGAKEEATATPGNGAGASTSSEGSGLPVALAASTHEVRCGCKIEGIGKCGNYVDVDGAWVEISNPDEHELGHMEWCGAQSKVEATVAGTVMDGKIELSELKVAAK